MQGDLILTLSRATLGTDAFLIGRAHYRVPPHTPGAVRRPDPVGGVRAAIGGFESAAAGRAADAADDVDWPGPERWMRMLPSFSGGAS